MTISVIHIIQRVSFIVVLSISNITGCPGGFQISMRYSRRVRYDDKKKDTVYRLKVE